MGFLSIQFPGSDIKKYQGEWKETDLHSLPDDFFFITDFTKNKIYYFIPKRESENIPEKELFYNDSGDVFSVNGRFYLNGLEVFMEGFEENGIQKAIYSRIKLSERNERSCESIFLDLAKTYKNDALVYLLSDEKLGTWMGATPEILLEGNAARLKTMALAGTKKTAEDTWTKKEEEEHQFVVNYISENIEKQSAVEIEKSPVKTIKAGKVFHLQTDFSFQLPKEKWKSLINDLHPTPAVCGTPKEAAQEYILRFEPHERLFYTGLIGWYGKNDLNVYVNLRCMQVLKNHFAFYVGGGITQESDIGAEWQETENKSKTLSSVIFPEAMQ